MFTLEDCLTGKVRFKTLEEFKLRQQKENLYHWQDNIKYGFNDRMTAMLGLRLNDSRFKEVDYKYSYRQAPSDGFTVIFCGEQWSISPIMLTYCDPPQQSIPKKVHKVTKMDLINAADNGVKIKVGLDCIGYHVESNRSMLRVYNRDLGFHVDTESKNAKVRVFTDFCNLDKKSVNKILKVLFTDVKLTSKGIETPRFIETSDSFNFNFETGKHESDKTFF